MSFCRGVVSWFCVQGESRRHGGRCPQVVAATDSELTVNVSTSHAWPSNLTLTKLNRNVVLTVPATAVVQTVTGGTLRLASLGAATRGRALVVWTQPAPASLKAERADDGVLAAALIQLNG